MYRLRITKDVKRIVDDLPGNVRQRVRRLIDSLRENPRPPRAKELRDLPGCYRQRVDHWRVIWEIDEANKAVNVLAVRRKTGPETYEDLDLRTRRP